MAKPQIHFTAEQLIKILQMVPKKTKIYVASDEEWNQVMTGIAFNYDEKKNLVFHGISGTEIE